MKPLTPLALAAALLAAAAGAAAQTSPWYLGVSQQWTYENNLFRVPDNAVPAGALVRNDTISRTSLVGGLDQRIGRQRLFGSATLRAERYADNGVLDNEGHSLTAGVDWQTVQALSGRLDLGSDRRLARFNEDSETGFAGGKNIEDVQRAGFTARLGGAAQLALEATIGWRRTDYSAVEYAGRENSQTTGNIGLRWRPRAGLVLGLGARGGAGEYPRFQQLPDGSYRADKWKRDGAELTLGLEPSGASRVDAQLVYGRTRFDEATQRDYSGLTGAASWTWQVGGRLRLLTRLARDDGQSSTYLESPLLSGVTDYSRVTDAFTLRADYELGGKTRLSAGYTQTQRDLVRTLPPNIFVPTDATGSDRTRELTLGARWQALHWLTLGCDYADERRTVSGVLSTPYRSKRAGCFGEALLR